MSEFEREQLKFLVTRVSDDGEYSRHLDYLLSDGSRRRVTIASASDNQVMRAAIGDALHKREVEGKQWQR